MSKLCFVAQNEWFSNQKIKDILKNGHKRQSTLKWKLEDRYSSRIAYFKVICVSICSLAMVSMFKMPLNTCTRYVYLYTSCFPLPHIPYYTSYIQHVKICMTDYIFKTRCHPFSFLQVYQYICTASRFISEGLYFGFQILFLNSIYMETWPVSMKAFKVLGFKAVQQ